MYDAIKTLIEEQVGEFIEDVMRPEKVVNGTPPHGQASGTERFGMLQRKGPREFASNMTLVAGSNDPLHWSNMVDRLNTPFDHVDRIFLQDFTEQMNLLDDDNNWFKTTYEHSDLFKEYRDEGKFFLDSFTYTPFIDYSQTRYEDGEDPDMAKTGIYTDTFLTDFNCGRYDEDYDGDGKKEQFDKNRQKITTNLYRLRNLQKDIEDVKESFRKSVSEETDAKTYIYTFCEHMAELFAKMSNIRMSYLVYGFKQPHEEWEGILALDIWYQMLYHAIDEQYPFKYDYVDRNPMQKLKVRTDGSGKYVEYFGKKVYKSNLGSGLIWYDSENGVGVDENYAYIWDFNAWNAVSGAASEIRSNRSECVTPRGVLKKIYGIVMDSDSTNYIINRPTGGWDDNNRVPVE